MNGKRLITFVAAAALLGSAAIASAQFSPLSRDHIANGVSQYLAGNSKDDGNPLEGGGGGTPLLGLLNPNGRSHIAAILFYERRLEGHPTDTAGGTPGLFLGCRVETLAPHSAFDIREGEGQAPALTWTPDGGHSPRYVEVLSVPRQPVAVNGMQTRVADGLGLTADDTGEFHSSEQMFPLDPRHFRPPLNQISPGQLQASIDCICDGLSTQGLPTDAFSESPFGILCL